ncbi:Catenin-beta-like Arm-motif containing nuclear family protein [Brugia pahangi]
MQEKVLVDVIPGSPLVDSMMQDDILEPQKTFAETHRQEVFAIIDLIPSFASSQRDTENRSERFRYLLDLYQEQPSLLDPFMEIMINRFDDVSNVAFALLAHISKVRGYKVFLSLLPHEMKYMEKVLSSLERYSDSVMDMDSRYILLLWTVILCKNPFDLSKFETKNGCNVLERMITVALPYLYLNTDRCQHSAALLLSLVVSREDARKKYLKKLIDPCISAIESCEGKWSLNNELVGSLRLLAAILKKGEREDLLLITDQVLKALHRLSNLEDSDFTVKKLTVKIVQRLGMVFLKPKIAKWRYNNGNCNLNLESDFGKCRELNILEVENFADEVHEVPYAKLEVVLNTILESLRDRHTDIRWAGAKGIGRILSRLPKHLASDVLCNIIKFNFNLHSGNAAWHGGCLAVAELARRGFLPLERLPDIMKILLIALVFEEPQGHHALGASVRDAACYICWSLARTFHPMDLEAYIEQIATTLVCVALFDREVNVRRAASAAFQEIVGRQGTFPNGIEILTKIDYFAVGQRCRTYLEISCQIARYSMYTQGIIEHLISFKITHWDEEIRLLSAEALHRLCASDPSFVCAQVLKKLIPLISNESLIMRQGGVVALAFTLSGLKRCGTLLHEELYENVTQIPSMVYPLCKKRTNSLGSKLMRRAMNVFIKSLSSVIPKRLIKTEDWLSCLELNFCDENEDIRKGACEAGKSFFKLYNDSSGAEFLMLRIRQVYLPQIIAAKIESDREGTAALLGVIPSEVLLLSTLSDSFAAEIIRTLTFTISGSSALDATWACGRRSCVEAITRIVDSIGIEPLGHIAELLDCLINSLDDYTMDKRGDIGRVLREEAMRALAIILPLAQNYSKIVDRISEAVCKIIQQSIEKIDATRECAALVMKRILQSGLKGIQEEEMLRKIYLVNGSNVDWRSPSCFKRLALLLKSSYYRYSALSGFIISAGGVTESTMRGASDALLSVISDVRGSRQELEIFLQCFTSILINNAGLLRVTQPLLRTLEQILSAQLLQCFEADPDSSPSLRKIVDRVAIEATIKGSAQKVRICISVLCHFLHFNSSSLVWQKSASLVVRNLRSRYPIIRRNAAQQLYECLISECDSSNEAERNKRVELLNLLSETKWNITGDEQYFVKVKLKRPRIDISNLSTATTTPEDILAALERDESQAVVVDEAAVKRIVMQLEKRCLKNREMRIKYGDEPAKFMESEIELNEAIQEMHALATQPDLYELLVDHGGTATLLQLLAHENSDVVGAVINLLQELTDVDTLNEGESGAAKLIDVLVADQLIETLVQQSIERMDETIKDEADAIHNALSVVENVLDFRPSFADICVEQGLFAWLLRRATQRGGLDANKMFASELLSLLLQSTELARKRLTEKVDGFDLLLRALATYKRHDPGSADEREHMENLFNAVCAALMYAPNRQKFLDGEGLQLMNLMLRERKQSRESALKVLDYATNGIEGRSNCAKFIDILAKQKRKDSTPDEHEEHVCSVLSSLLRSCGEEGRSRIFSKFSEHEYEKVDRAVELVLKYQERVDRFDARQANLTQNSKLSDDEIEQLYLDKLDAGLYTLQRIILILADICSSAMPGCRNRAVKLFQMRTGNGKLSKHLVPVLEEYEINLGAEADEERRRTRQLIARVNSIDKN